ncbi:uncharacterized protein LOC143900651 [Temnothorax americanus]|uniref:uncharacterized protein LOC143900651 n=1 Tax=Temnothorax americanus TaxID=1964332 RepID=UPI0040691224
MNFTRAERRLMGGAGVRSVPSSIPVSTLLADHIFIHSTKNATTSVSPAPRVHLFSAVCIISSFERSCDTDATYTNACTFTFQALLDIRRLQCFLCYLAMGTSVYVCICILRTNLSPPSSCFDSLPCVLKMLPIQE